MSETILTQILTTLQGMDARLGALEAGQTSIEARLGTLEAGQASVGMGQVSLAEQIARVRVEVMARIDRLQDAVTGMRNDMTVTFGRADNVDRKVDSTRDEVRSLAESFSILFKRMQNIDERLRAMEEKH